MSDPNESAAYEAARGWLEQSPPSFIDPKVVPSVVNMRDIVLEPLPSDATQEQEETVISLHSPGRARALLNAALEGLDGLDKEEANLIHASPWTVPLTQIVTNEVAASTQQALEQLQACASASPRKVCQYPFKKNDIVWMCRTCQADETCALCHDCFSNSSHEGHDVAFFHAQEGGCCDCGDPEAWDPAGFCPKHGEAAHKPTPPRRAVCQKPFKKNDIYWICRTCGADDTCAMCNECYNNSDHEGHDVAFNHATEGGCCDCGDVDAWNPKGFCCNHGPPPEGESGAHPIEDLLPPGLVPRVRGVVPAVMDWMMQRLVATSLESSRRTKMELSEAETLFGPLGREGHGLYIILQADDVHGSTEFGDGLRSFFGSSTYLDDTTVRKLVQSLGAMGQLVIWGTMEMVTELGTEQVQAWLSGDTTATSEVASLLIKRMAVLKRRGFNCRIMTLKEIQQEQQAVAIIQWLSALAFSCDPLCQTVADYIHPEKHLEPLLKADFLLSSRFTKGWYSLLLTLLAVPAFKSKLGAAYCETYAKLTADCATGMGVLERSAYTLSVQFLNRDTYVLDLVSNRDLLSRLGKALLATLHAATSDKTGRLDCSHVVLVHRRYSPCNSDLNYVINVKGMKRLATCTNGSFMNDLVAGMSLAQGIDEHTWRHWNLGHVEDEDTGWYGAFNLCITLGSLFERILAFEDDDASPVDNPMSPLSTGLLTCVELSQQLLTKGLAAWQTKASESFYPTPYSTAVDAHRRRPACLPFSTIAAQHGCTVAFRQLAIGQTTPFSLHVPLHRLSAASIREVCLRPDEMGVHCLMQRLADDVTKPALDELFMGLLEYPVLVLSRAAQVRAGLWRRNGPGLNEQVIKYADPTFCRSMRDSDLLLTQFAVLKPTSYLSPTPRPVGDVSIAAFVHLFLHRLGLFDFVGLSEAPSVDPDAYEAETSKGLYPRESGESNGNNNGLVLPWSYTPARDASDCRALVEEFLYTLILFTTELPPPPPLSKEDHTDQAKRRLKREVIHRLAASPKTHSELADINLVLCWRDNLLLNELGKAINPDDATAAMLGQVLGDVAERKASRSRLEPDRFVLLKSEWGSYDPSFFHISVESHQTAAESRPVPSKKEEQGKGLFGAKVPYAPQMPQAHPRFQRLRRDVTADASVLAVAFRILHMHCRGSQRADLVDLEVGRNAYDNEARSETSLARAVHLLTLGCFAWEDAAAGASGWRENGGGSPGSVFFDKEEAPTTADWVNAAFLTSPCDLLDCKWYDGEENMLQLLRRLAVDGGASGIFVAQDPALQFGAAWICEFVVKHCAAAASLILGNEGNSEGIQKNGSELGEAKLMSKMNAQGDLVGSEDDGKKFKDAVAREETDFEKRKREAKEKALARINSQADKFASSVGITICRGTQVSPNGKGEAKGETEFDKKKRLAKERALAKINSDASKFAAKMGLDLVGKTETDLERRKRLAKEKVLAKINAQAAKFANLNNIELDSKDADGDQKMEDVEVNTSKSLREWPQCIICSDSDAECFVAFSQASTVLKGGGGPHATEDTRMLTARRYAGTFLALCGHAVHSDCSASYLAKVKQNADQASDNGEFRCPLCQRPSNCLVPFVDVELDWIDSPTCLPVTPQTSTPYPLDSFLISTQWYMSRHEPKALWDGHSAFGGSPAVPLSNNTEENVQVPGDVAVVKNLMENLYGIAYEADTKRLGEQMVQKDAGEFRHYTVEKHFYNSGASGNPASWPSCVFSGELSENQLRSFSREHFMAQLLTAIQSFTYTACCEAFEARRNIRNKSAGSSNAQFASAPSGDALKPVYSKFGICGTLCSDQVILMPKPSATEDEGSQPFNGRLGRLRNLGLVMMAAAGAVGPDLVQLVMPFPTKVASSASELPERAPISHPLLFGNILTHVVAAFCTTSGQDITPSSWRSVLKGNVGIPDRVDTAEKTRADIISEDCEGFLKLGLLARVLQVLCKEIGVKFESTASFTKALVDLAISEYEYNSPMELDWLKSCRSLLITTFGNSATGKRDEAKVSVAEDVKGTFQNACLVAAGAASSYLADAGTIVQLLVPNIMARYDASNINVTAIVEENDQDSSIRTLAMLKSLFRVESMDEMLNSELVVEVVTNWFDVAASFTQRARSVYSNNEGFSLVTPQSFHAWDWPLESVEDYKSAALLSKKKIMEAAAGRQSPKKTFPLLGGYSLDVQSKTNDHPRVEALTSSYMDLYAKVGALKPDAERTAVCLICGEALDSSGIGECTAHSYKCGAGVGICFLLQECVGIILQRGEGSFIHSIYVDSHGETPRGRPLYLDPKRLEHIREIWGSHQVRQQVLAERESTQQGVVTGFY